MRDPFDARIPASNKQSGSTEFNKRMGMGTQWNHKGLPQGDYREPVGEKPVGISAGKTGHQDPMA